MFKSLIFSILLTLSFPIPNATIAPSAVKAATVEKAFQNVTPEPEPKDSRLDGIRLIICGNSDGAWTGTMFHYDANRYITAYHVAHGGICFDKATHTRLKAIHLDVGNDFAIVESPVSLDNKYYKLSCAPFITGNTYHAIGCAGGESLLAQDLIAVDKYTNGFFIYQGSAKVHLRQFIGNIIPGMSGGPVMDDKWVVHGINNASWSEKNLSWSRELKDSTLCRK